MLREKKGGGGGEDGGGHGHKLQAEEGVGSSCIESAHMKGKNGGSGGFPPRV